jgi:glycerol-3-phosphate dehydrogenase (NAD(P)+)
VSVVGIVNGTEVGEALVARLTTDGRKVISGVDGSAFRRMGAEARLILVDTRRADLARVLRELGAHLDPNHLVAHTVHGLGAEGSATALIEAESPVRRTGVLAGPLLVPALRAGRPTAAVIASRHPEVVDEFSAVLSTPRMRVYRSHDPSGVELCASLAELSVLACGVADALQVGAPARALLIVRMVRELGRMVTAVGGDVVTATGLAGLGDILVRGADDTANAYQIGRKIALGQAPEPATLEVLRATAARLAANNLHKRVSAHVFEGLAALLANKVTPAVLVEQLMTVRVLDE